MPQQPQVKITKGGNPVPNFEYVLYDQVQDIYEQNKAGPPPKAASSNAKTKIKKPPRPPNAFILYRRAKQPGILTRHQGITNNEVSKEIDAVKQEHMKKYPGYRYRPRRPQERKRRIQSR
ncbi:unnamed protein product [Rhizophagus irregularis]|nr:unnamed protein product [Rhizophagus irregularis]